MIIREDGSFYILIRQHDHGLLSGEIAAHWGNEHFEAPEHKLVLTTSLHDVSWYETDQVLQWDEAGDHPYDFTSLPLESKLPMYEKGLNLTERLNPYGGLLTSMHYCSFFKKNQNEKIDHFLQGEHRRQERLKRKFFGERFEDDLRHLQLWDHLSLYVCLNEPGVKKEKEHPWYQNGIKTEFKTGETLTLNLRWLNERTITLDPFPFAESWSTTLPYSKVRRSLGPADPDINKTYEQHIRFVPNERSEVGSRSKSCPLK